MIRRQPERPGCGGASGGPGSGIAASQGLASPYRVGARHSARSGHGRGKQPAHQRLHMPKQCPAPAWMEALIRRRGTHGGKADP
jgi:hypothetical protein